MSSVHSIVSRVIWFCGVGAVAIGLVGCANQGKPGQVLDEAARANVKVDDLIRAPRDKADYFHDMDAGISLNDAESQGRATWLVWTGGNDRFWDAIGVSALGTFDLLKIVSSHPAMKPEGYTQYGRDIRWNYLGLVNEPCFTQATGPDPNRYGLWLDVRDPSCPPDPFADALQYPGVKLGARGKTVAVGSFYGEPSGIVGLRLFPNPAFDEKARKDWDPERYYRDPKYYFSKDLVRPYRIGMSCGFCHVGPNPERPPADPEHPTWANLSSDVGAQYFWVDRVFNWQGDANRGSFFYQLFHTSKPGTLDTSIISTDNINNPRTMNAVYYLLPRMLEAKRWGKETLSGGGLNNKQFNDFVPASDPLAQFFKSPDTTWTPRVLKDGSDSVGGLGALNRVYINIGLFSEEWLLHFTALVGGKKITPIEIAVAEKNSVYWRATENLTVNMARFFLKATDPHRLKDAPGGATHMTEDAATLTQGKVVFAERCARCHSSKIPPLPAGLDLENCNGKDYLDCWNRYWQWSKTDDFRNQMRPIVLADDFIKDNYLSTELRVPVTLLQTNACSPLATNAIAGNIWDNFSSQSYKDLPSVGTVKIRQPVTGAEVDYPLPAGGRGYTRPASLASLWSTAPFLQNNTVGHFEPSPSVEARMRSFQDSIEQMLWPERREKDRLFANENGPGVGLIQRTTAPSTIWLPTGYVPDSLRPLLGVGRRLFPMFFHNGELEIGPIPQGTPVNLVANLDMLGLDLTLPERATHFKKLLALLARAKRDLKGGQDVFADNVFVEQLWDLDKCKDLVVNKGHYFGTDYLRSEEPGLGDADKRALIAFLKTL